MDVVEHFAAATAIAADDVAVTMAMHDKIGLQPLCQRMLAPRRSQRIGDQHQRPIAQRHGRVTIGPRQVVEDRVEPDFAPQRTRRQHRPPVPRPDRSDIGARDAVIVRRVAVQETVGTQKSRWQPRRERPLSLDDTLTWLVSIPVCRGQGA